MIFIRRKKIEILLCTKIDRSMMCRIVFASRKKEQEHLRKKVKWTNVEGKKRELDDSWRDDTISHQQYEANKARLYFW